MVWTILNIKEPNRDFAPKKRIDLCEKIIKFDQSIWSLPQSHTQTDIYLLSLTKRIPLAIPSKSRSNCLVRQLQKIMIWITSLLLTQASQNEATFIFNEMFRFLV